MMDRARDMQARAGLRPYSVTIVRARSTRGTRRGDGPSEVLQTWEIKPIPKVGDASALRRIIAPDQLRESGTLIVSEISSSYTEDMLLGRGADGKPIAPDEWVFWEVAIVGGDGRCGQARRFVTDGVPTFIPESAQWTVTLVRAHEDRERGTGVLR